MMWSSISMLKEEDITKKWSFWLGVISVIFVFLIIFARERETPSFGGVSMSEEDKKMYEELLNPVKREEPDNGIVESMRVELNFDKIERTPNIAIPSLEDINSTKITTLNTPADFSLLETMDINKESDDTSGNFTGPNEKKSPWKKDQNGLWNTNGEGDSIGEKISRKALEEFYNRPFPKIRPNFLRNPETNTNLELDCFNEELMIGLEYNGQQHYNSNNSFHKTIDDFVKLIRRDKFKLKQCDRIGVYLIRVPHTIPKNSIRDFIWYYLPENVLKRQNNEEEINEDFETKMKNFDK